MTGADRPSRTADEGPSGAVGWIIGGSFGLGAGTKTRHGRAGGTANVRSASDREHLRTGGGPVAIRCHQRLMRDVAPERRRGRCAGRLGSSARAREDRVADDGLEAHRVVHREAHLGGLEDDRLAAPPRPAATAAQVAALPPPRRRASRSVPTPYTPDTSPVRIAIDVPTGRSSRQATRHTTSGSAANPGLIMRRATAAVMPPAANTPRNASSDDASVTGRTVTPGAGAGDLGRGPEDHLRCQPGLLLEPAVLSDRRQFVGQVLVDPEEIREALDAIQSRASARSSVDDGR